MKKLSNLPRVFMTMKSQIRAELRELKRNRRFLSKAYSKDQNEQRKIIQTASRELQLLERCAEKDLARQDKRIAILTGRLS